MPYLWIITVSTFYLTHRAPIKQNTLMKCLKTTCSPDSNNRIKYHLVCIHESLYSCCDVLVVASNAPKERHFAERLKFDIYLVPPSRCSSETNTCKFTQLTMMTMVDWDDVRFEVITTQAARTGQDIECVCCVVMSVNKQ